MSHKHNVYEADPHFSIDSVTKKIKNGSTQKTRLIQGDHNSECFGFDLARYVEGHDMMLCDTVMIHYINMDSATRAENKGVYEVKDLQVNPNDKNKVVFSWTITENVTLYAGPLSFLIKFMCTENGETVYRWNTDINSEISISNGMSNDETITELFPDILAQWHDEIFGDAENAVANINLAEQDALANVRAEGLKQVSDIQKVIEPIQASVDQIYKNYKNKASVIEGTAEGNVILLGDSAEQPFVDFKLFGKSEQYKNSGSQLFDASKLSKNVFNQDGLTITGNGDGSFTITGTGQIQNSMGISNFYDHDWMVENLKVGTLKIAADNETNPKFYVADLEYGTYKYAGEEIEVTQEILEKANGRLMFGFEGKAGEQIVPGTVRPMVYQDGDGTWEEYNGGVVVPSPENPSEIVSVENPEIDVWGKNLLKNNLQTATNQGVTYTENADGSITVKGTATADSYYTFDFGNKIPIHGKKLIASIYGCTGGTSLTVGYFKKDGSAVNSVAYANNSEFAFSYPEEAYTTRIFIAVNKGTTVDTVLYPMIRLVESNSDFGEVKERQNLTLPYTLHGIPVTSGGNYTDSEGQEWICDEIDLERGVLVKRIHTEVFDGSSDERIYMDTTKEITQVFSIGLSKEQSENYMGNFRTNLFPDYAIDGDKEKAEPNILSLYVAVNKNRLSEVSTDGFREWLSNNNLYFQYILAEPIEIALSEAEISAYKMLLSNYPNTTILNDSGANMAVRYGIDTKSYIDKKFAELMVLHE